MKGIQEALGIEVPNHMKGLQLFIADIRNCTSKEQEQKRVERELAKIRLKFTSPKSISGYDRKKYVWKLLYSYMLGYDIDFGHFQAVELCSSAKFSEKSAGYLAISLLLAENSDILRLVVNSLKNDLNSGKEHIVALALNIVANIGGSEFADNLFHDISKMLLNSASYPAYLKRKACICLLRLYRKESETIQPDVWRKKLVELFHDRDIGLLTSVSGFTIALLEQGSFPVVEWLEIVPAVVQCIHGILNESPENYSYYRVPAPWLQTKLLRILQFFPPLSYDADKLQSINLILRSILVKPSATRTPSFPSPVKKRSKADAERQNRSNAEHAILFEAMSLLIHLEAQCDPESTRMAASLLGSFISCPDGNIRYLGLETMARLATNPDSFEHLERYKNLIFEKMHEPDISIRRQSLNLLYALCRPSNWQQIVDELLENLANSDPLLQEELVLKIAIIAERNAPNFKWYVDVVFRMLESAPDSVGDDVWYRVVQVVTGFDDRSSESEKTSLQSHAALKSWRNLHVHYPHETLVKLGAYLMGEFGHLITDVTPQTKFETLVEQYNRCSNATKAILVLAIAKLLNANPDELRRPVISFLEDIQDQQDVELQQRSCELLQLARDEDLLENVLNMMPLYAERVQLDNPLTRRLKFQQKSRAHTRAQLEEAAKSEGGVYKLGSAQPGRERGIFITPEESNITVQDGMLLPNPDKGPAQRGGNSDSDSESASDSSEEEAADDPRALWLNLCIMPQGRLCTTKSLILEAKQEYATPQGRIMIMFRNCSQEPITNLSAVLPEIPHMQFQIDSDVPTTLRPGEQAFQVIKMLCMGPFTQPAKYFLQFSSGPGPPTQLPLMLPAVLTKFIVPTELQMQQFMQYFEMMEGAPRESQVVAPAKTPPGQWRNYLAHGFNFFVLQESTESTTVAAGTLHTSTPDASGKPLSVPCLVRLDFEPNRRLTRITVRTERAEVTAAIIAILRMHLQTPEQGSTPTQSPPMSNAVGLPTNSMQSPPTWAEGGNVHQTRSSYTESTNPSYMQPYGTMGMGSVGHGGSMSGCGPPANTLTRPNYPPNSSVANGFGGPPTNSQGYAYSGASGYGPTNCAPYPGSGYQPGNYMPGH